MANLYKTNGDIDRALSPHLVKGANQRKASPLQQQSAKNGCTAIMGDPEMSTSKPNQVGTVLLYGVPIVSLHIESQERLCLAQISNTLLKHFSYNEIHNRRVALGITCVQCTPVQLEILRRAGAMPVSSRRCGMITRREAERLCKSFLGDNAPPRLPDDFAFSVYHECAWGCRGQFLPSRYNSSRAKCIKCSYCGLFFSPNKFIFHSHRLGPSDKYIQPDAANFNSWRRHMKLSGVSPDEIIHAWEDVKAMFNGGTRKRLMGSVPSSSSSSSVSASNPSRTSSSQVECGFTRGMQPVAQTHTRQSPKRAKEASANTAATQRSPISSPIARANTSAVTNQQYPIRSFSVQSSKVNGDCPRLVTNPSFCGNVIRTPSTASDLPASVQFSRSFMDYMWHSQQQQQQQPSAKPDFQFSAYALPWLKHQPSAHMLFGHQSYNANALNNKPVATTHEDDAIGRKGTLGLTRTEHDRHSPTYYKNSAFKPVHLAHRPHASAVAAKGFEASPDVGERIDESLSAEISEDEAINVGRNKRKIRRSYGKQSRSAKSNGIVANTTVEESSSDEEILDIETTEDQTENAMLRCVVNGMHCGSTASVGDECAADADIGNERVSSERSDYEMSTKNIRLQCGSSEPRDMSASATATSIDDCANNNKNNNNENTINNNKKLNHDNCNSGGASNNHSINNTENDTLCGRSTNNFVNNNNNNSISVKSVSDAIECEASAIDVLATDEQDTLSMRGSDADDGDDNSDVDVVVDTQKRKANVLIRSLIKTDADGCRRGDSLSPSNAVPTTGIGHEHGEHAAEHDDTSAICMMVNLKKEVLHNNSNYPLNNLDSGTIGTKSASFLDLSKDDDRDMTDLSEMQASAGTATAVAAAAAAAEMTFPSFVPDIKLPQFPIMTTMDAASAVQPVERYSFDRKCVRSPSPTSASVFFGNTDLLANRIGQFYPRPVPHVFQHHHLSKHFHPWHPDMGFFEGKQIISGPRKSPRPTALMHNFLQTGGTHAGGATGSGTLNLSTNQYHQTQAHLLHQHHHHSRPN